MSLKTRLGHLITSKAAYSLIRLITGDRYRLHGLTFDLRGFGIEPRVKSMLFWDLYEKPELRLIMKYLQPNFPVVELGGSIGIVSTHIASRIHPQSLYVVEANPNLVPVIGHQLETNKLDAHTIVVHGAIAGADQLYFKPGLDNTSGYVDYDPLPGSFPIPAFSFSSFLQQQDIGDYVLVADIEGGENDILFYDSDSLVRCHSMIVELHECQYRGVFRSFEDQKRKLQQLGFSIAAQDGPVIYAVRH